MPRARRIWRAVVVDRSMEPALRAGDRLLVLPAGPGGLPLLAGGARAGSVVIVEREGRFDVKRVGGITGGALWLLGDNAAASSDSRASGPVPLHALRGIVVWRSGPHGRRGRIPKLGAGTSVSPMGRRTN